MKKSSFGFMQVCDHAGERIEYLEFLREGRLHRHKKAECFTVLQGGGELITDDYRRKIEAGKTYVVEAGLSHKMKPGKEGLRIVLTYVEQ